MAQKVSYRLLTVLAVFAILLTGCGGGTKTLKDQIIGKWEGNDPDLGGQMTFEFMKDGKAQITVSSMTLGVTYTWVDDDTIELSIDMAGQTETQQMDVAVNGNTLSLTSDGQTVEFTKK
jgi:hypothetical protein